ncbi:MAG: oligosaccharide flippase family protein [Anaerolineales bacterium]|nr:oligosaccharide flippase family protein [Anaerolineales bacterium]
MNKYIKAIIFNLCFFGVNTLFFLVITSLAIKVMGEEFYGLWMILNAILLFSGVGTLNIGLVVNKFASEAGGHALPKGDILATGTVILLPMAVIVAGVLLLLRNWIAAKIQVAPDLQAQFSQAMLITAFSIFPQFLSKIPQGYLLSQIRNDIVRGVESASNILLWSGAVLIAWSSRNLFWMSLWALTVLVITMLIYFVYARRFGCRFGRLRRNVFERMIGFSGFAFLEMIAIALYQQFDRILVGFVIGPAAAGVYSVGTSIGLRLSIIIGQFTEVMIPYASRQESLAQRRTLLDAFRKLSRLISLLLAVISSLLIIWMDVILFLWISPVYAQKYTLIFRVLILAYTFLALARPGHQTLTGTGRVKFTSLVYLANSLFMLAGVYFFASQYGLLGAAGANLIMIGLLAYNVYVYAQYQRTNIWQALWADLRFGVFFPTLSLALTSWSDSVVLRSFASVCVITLVIIQIQRDLYFQDQIRMVLNRLFNKVFGHSI